MRSITLLTTLGFIALGVSSRAAKKSSGGFTGPSSVQGQLDEDQISREARRLGVIDDMLELSTSNLEVEMEPTCVQ